jgi:YggT family protein
VFVLSNFLVALAYVLRIAGNFFIICIIASTVLSFIMPYYNKYKALLDSISGIILNPIRKIMNFNFGAFDFTSMIGILIIIFFDRFIVQTLLDVAARL